MSQRAAEGIVIEEKYRLERELGAGGMGAVWLATQLMVDRKVAVKLLHPAYLESDDLQARFEVEAKAIGRLNHPNCITLFDFGYSEDLKAFYTVIEYVNGQSLDQRLGSKMPLETVLDIIRNIALALDHAHHQGILHRDLKPENVMMAQMTDGTEMVKVLDFGIARIVKGDAAQEAERITKAGEVFGTPAYMSPEQARSTRQLKPSSDLYSLGVMFYELVEGKLPFFAHSAFDLLMMHVTKPVPPIQRDDVPESLKELIYSLLDKEPARRPQKGKELADRIAEIDLDAMPVAPSAASGETTGPVPTLLNPPRDETPGPDQTLDDEHASQETQVLAESDRLPQPSAELMTLETERPEHRRSRFWSLAGIFIVAIILLALLLINVFGENGPARADDISEETANIEKTTESPEKLPENTTLGAVEKAPPKADPIVPPVLKEEETTVGSEHVDTLQRADKTVKPQNKPSENESVEKESVQKKNIEKKKKRRRPPREKLRDTTPRKEASAPEKEHPVFESLSPSEDSVKMPSVDL